MPEPQNRVERLAWRDNTFTPGERTIPEETAIAFTYNGGAYAVMMATPQDLEDFAVGFSLTEGIVSSARDIRSIDIVEEDLGIEVRMWLDDARSSAYDARRRHLAGPTGCGLCGIESLAEAMRTPRVVSSHAVFTPRQVTQATKSLGIHQTINHATRAVHAAAFFSASAALVALREDVGRHNAMDKLAGALARGSTLTDDGFVVCTSRISVEMVQKAAAIGVSLLVAVSAPTALAVRMADAAGMTLVAVARDDGFEIFTHAQRFSREVSADVA